SYLMLPRVGESPSNVVPVAPTMPPVTPVTEDRLIDSPASRINNRPSVDPGGGVSTESSRVHPSPGLNGVPHTSPTSVWSPSSTSMPEPITWADTATSSSVRGNHGDPSPLE